MRISVVVPTRDRARLLRGCLDALRAQARPADEVVVVDNGSRDETAAMVVGEYPWARLAEEPRAGVHHARNRGLIVAQGEVVAFTDDDCRPAPGWLAALEEAFADPAVACAGGPLLPSWEERPSPALLRSGRALSSLGLLNLGPTARRLDPGAGFLVGGNLSVRRAAAAEGFVAVQAFRPLGVCGDDYELSRRFARRGAAIYVPGARVLHLIPAVKARWPALLTRVFWFGASAARVGGRLAPRRGPRELLGWEGAVSAADALGHLYGRWAVNSSQDGGLSAGGDAMKSRCQSPSETGFRKP